MARRNRRRGPASRRRPPGPAPGTRPPSPAPVAERGSGAQEEEPAEVGTAAAGSSLLPRRAAPAAPPAAAAAPPQAAARALPSESLLPRRVAGRAERQRRAEENLAPLDETPAVPSDRLPYLGADLRKVFFVSMVMVAMVILGFFVIH